MKTYLGDGVYVEWMGVGLVLTTGDGEQIITIAPATYNKLTAFVAELRERVQATAPRKAQED